MQQQQQQQQPAQGGRRKKLALVFGREVSGLTAAEVEACDGTLSIPIGRLQGE
jgi:tRNA C32,U32 (ribose-2'-O)-methylase TrmJ